MATILNPTLARGLSTQVVYDSKFKADHYDFKPSYKKSRKGWLKDRKAHVPNVIPESHILLNRIEGSGKSAWHVAVFLGASEGARTEGLMIGVMNSYARDFTTKTEAFPLYFSKHAISRIFERMATTSLSPLRHIACTVFDWYMDGIQNETLVYADHSIEFIEGTIHISWERDQGTFVITTFITKEVTQ